jgi:hypothetical protein
MPRWYAWIILGGIVGIVALFLAAWFISSFEH